MNDPRNVTEQNIDSYKQNKIRYVEQDLLAYAGVDTGLTRTVLRARGFEKWIANRREFIRLKDALKHRITLLLSLIKDQPQGKKRQRLVGRMEGLVETRQAIRKICHSKRWRPETE